MTNATCKNDDTTREILGLPTRKELRKKVATAKEFSTEACRRMSGNFRDHSAAYWLGLADKYQAQLRLIPAA